MPRFVKYLLSALGVFALIFFIGIVASRSVRHMGGLDPRDAEYDIVEHDTTPIPPGRETETRPDYPKSKKPEKRITVRDFLIADAAETDGFGLYSYLLFTAPPSPATQAKYRALLKAFLQKISSSEKVEKYVARKFLNITYIPVSEKPGGEFDSQPVEAQIDWLLAHYNWARSTVILANIPAATSSVPFISSVQNPAFLGDNPPYFIFQDFAQAPPHLCGLWLDKFIRQAANEEFWEKDRLLNFVVNLRTAVAVLGSGVQAVSHSMDWWQKKMEKWVWVEKVTAAVAVPPQK